MARRRPYNLMLVLPVQRFVDRPPGRRPPAAIVGRLVPPPLPVALGAGALVLVAGWSVDHERKLREQKLRWTAMLAMTAASARVVRDAGPRRAQALGLGVDDVPWPVNSFENVFQGAIALGYRLWCRRGGNRTATDPAAMAASRMGFYVAREVAWRAALKRDR